jgi:hypothetical protein
MPHLCCLQLTGEDPDAIPNEAPPPAKRQQHAAPDSPRKQHHRGPHSEQPEQQERPAAAAEGRGPGGGRLADAWQAPGSLFSLLTTAEPAAAADGKDGSKKKHKEHKHKKEKHKKKDKVG